MSAWSIWVAVGHEPDWMMSNPISASEQAGGSGRDATLTESVAAFLRSAPAALSPATTESGAKGRFHSLPCRQNVATPSGNLIIAFRQRVRQPDIERANRSSPNLLAREGQNRAHPRPRQWLWLAADGCASCPLLQRGSPKFLPLGCAHSSRDKKPRSAPSSTALRPYGCSSASPCL